MQKILTPLATIVVCAALAYFFWPSSSHDASEEEEEHQHEFVVFSKEQLAHYGIEIRPAEAGVLQQKVQAPAHLSVIPDQQAHVLPKVSGVALFASKNLGERVEIGEVLAVLESKEMAEVKAAYLAALKKEQLASISWEREQSLYDKQLVSAQEYHTASQQWEEAAIELELSQQRLQALGMDLTDIVQLTRAAPDQLRHYELRAPIAGQIIERHITPGELISTNQETYEIADLGTIWAEIHIFPQDRPHVKVGQAVELTSFDDNKTQGTLIYLSPIINPDTYTSVAIAEVDNSNGEWFPGAFVQATLLTETVPVGISVPKKALQEIDGTISLFVAEGDGFAVKLVTIGRSDDTHCEVIDGISAGDVYACTNTFLLKAELQKDEAEHMD